MATPAQEKALAALTPARRAVAEELIDIVETMLYSMPALGLTLTVNEQTAIISELIRRGDFRRPMPVQDGAK